MYFRPQDALRKWRLGKVESFYNLRLHQFNDALQICIWKCSEIIFCPIFQKRIPSWLSSSLNPLKSFRLDFIIVSKDLRKERGSDPELLFTSFRLDLSNFFLNFFPYIKILYLESSYKFPPGRSLTVSPSTTLPTWDEKSWGNDKNKKYESDDICKNQKIDLFSLSMNPWNYCTHFEIKSWARSCNVGNDRFRKLVRRRKTADLPCADRRELFPRLRPFDISILLCNNY